MKVVIKVASQGQVRTIEDTGSRGISLFRDGTERIEGEDGRVFAYRDQSGYWWHPGTSGLILELGVFDD